MVEYSTARSRRARADAERISELRWLWRSACSGTALARHVYTPSGIHVGVPLIGQIDLGPPVSFTVQMRPGQGAADIVAAEAVIAATLGGNKLRVIGLAPPWVKVVLLTTS